MTLNSNNPTSRKNSLAWAVPNWQYFLTGMNCNLQARLKVLSVEVETVALLQTMSQSGSPDHVAATERELELRHEIESLRKLFCETPSEQAVGSGKE
jgi:hypothetical protein